MVIKSNQVKFINIRQQVIKSTHAKKGSNLIFLTNHIVTFMSRFSFHNYGTPYVIIVQLLNKLVEIFKILQKCIRDYDTLKTTKITQYTFNMTSSKMNYKTPRIT